MRCSPSSLRTSWDHHTRDDGKREPRSVLPRFISVPWFSLVNGACPILNMEQCLPAPRPHPSCIICPPSCQWDNRAPNHTWEGFFCFILLYFSVKFHIIWPLHLFFVGFVMPHPPDFLSSSFLLLSASFPGSSLSPPLKLMVFKAQFLNLLSFLLTNVLYEVSSSPHEFIYVWCFICRKSQTKQK